MKTHEKRDTHKKYDAYVMHITHRVICKTYHERHVKDIHIKDIWRHTKRHTHKTYDAYVRDIRHREHIYIRHGRYLKDIHINDTYKTYI